MCGANIDLIDVMTKDTIGSVVISGSSSAYGLPMWQSVKITNNSFAASNKVVIVVRPKLSLPISNHSHLWAVANIRECPSTGENAFNFLIFFIYVIVVNCHAQVHTCITVQLFK